MKTTTAREVGEGEWFDVLVSVVRELDETGEKASAEAIAEVLASRLGGDAHLGRALMKGMDAMAEYAAGDLSMRWSEPGAAEMSRLRADLFNGVWAERTREVMRA